MDIESQRATIHWKSVEQHFTVELIGFQFYPVGNFRKFISFGLGTVRCDRVNKNCLNKLVLLLRYK